jgi:ATP-dependent exoDNAse (exonuclease V) beta subunit
MLYVAFTRAENELYINIPAKKRETNSNISYLLSDFIKQYAHDSDFNFGTLHTRLDKQNEELHVSFGTKQKHSTKTQVLHESTLDFYTSIDYQSKLNLRYSSENYFSADPQSPKIRRNYGILMHRIFAEINTASECESAINKLLDDGLINNEDIGILKQKLEKALEHPIAKHWFDGSWDIKTETALITPYNPNSTLLRRPDRVMTRNNNETVIIDYKFGLIEENRYNKQILNYIDILKQMNYNNIKAYIWYVDLEKIVEL